MGEHNPIYEKTHTKEIKESIKNKLKGYKHSEETRINMSKARGLTIYVFSSLNNKFLSEFVSSRAASKYFNCTDTHVIKYARSGSIFKGEYILSLISNLSLTLGEIKQFSNSKEITIYLYSLENQLLETFSSLIKAGEYFQGDPKIIL